MLLCSQRFLPLPLCLSESHLFQFSSPVASLKLESSEEAQGVCLLVDVPPSGGKAVEVLFALNPSQSYSLSPAR